MNGIQYVLVTGATGYIGAHIVDELLRRGLRVRGTARSQWKADEMLRCRPQYADHLDFVFVGDLTESGVFDEAVKDVDAIIHTASPVRYDVTDNERDLILPAIQGTQSLLSATQQNPRIRRLVFTSSYAAVITPSLLHTPGHTFTAAQWNPITYAEGVAGSPLAAYRAGKTHAERAAWAAVARRSDDNNGTGAPHAHFDLVSICPPVVFGPPAHPLRALGELNDSLARLWRVACGARALPDAPAPIWADVRDVAAAHVEALLRPGVGNVRFTLAAPEGFTYRRAADVMREEFGWARERVPQGCEGEAVPEWPKGDGETAREALGITYRSFRESIVDTVRQLKEIELREAQV